MPTGQSTVGSGYFGTVDYLTHQGYVKKIDPVTRMEIYLPPGKEGDVYKTDSDALYEYRGGDWQLWQSPLEKSFGLEGGAFEGVEGLTNFYETFMTLVNNPFGAGTIALQGAEGMTEEEFIERLARADNPQDSIDEVIKNIATPEAIAAAQYHLDPEKFIPETTVESWQKQMNDLLAGLDTGEYDLENLPEDNIMSDWIRDVAKLSGQTGDILGDFIDEEGNLAPELQEMQNWFATHQDNQAEWQQFNRDLAMHAISQGRSVNSGYYSEHVANSVGNYAAGIATQATEIIHKEIEAQWKYIANSLERLLIDAGRASEAERFIDQMNTEYDAMLQEYNQEIMSLSEAIAQNKAAQFGDIFTGILSGILNIGLSFL
jgi:hypothetical protein